MSYVALVTDQFDEVIHFYGELLGFPAVDVWDRANARGQRFDTGGMRLEIMDNTREQRQLEIREPAERFHIVIEVDNVDAARQQVKIDAPPAQDSSWGARFFQVNDPDGIPVTFLQWLEKGEGDQ